MDVSAWFCCRHFIASWFWWFVSCCVWFVISFLLFLPGIMELIACWSIKVSLWRPCILELSKLRVLFVSTDDTDMLLLVVSIEVNDCVDSGGWSDGSFDMDP